MSRLLFFLLPCVAVACLFAVIYLAADDLDGDGGNDDGGSGAGAISPTPQPTIPCDESFSNDLSRAFFVRNNTLLTQECMLQDLVPFMQTLTSPLRFESVVGNMAAFLFLCLAVQLGGIPSVTRGDKPCTTGVILWGIWMAYAVIQFFATLAAQIMGILAVFSLAEQYRDELLAVDMEWLGPGRGAGIGAEISFCSVFVLSHCFRRTL